MQKSGALIKISKSQNLKILEIVKINRADRVISEALNEASIGLIRSIYELFCGLNIVYEVRRVDCYGFYDF